MNYWITVHNPHPTDSLPWHIYLQEQHKDAAEGIQEGDMVFFYETKGSRLKGKGRGREGAMAIVCMAKVIGKMHHRDDAESVAEYDNGESKYWSWCVPATDHDFDGFISRPEVVDILGYKENYYFKGFNNGAGLKKLTRDQGQSLFGLFCGSNSTWR